MGDSGGGHGDWVMWVMVMVMLVLCSIDGPLEAEGCYAMILFVRIHGRKIIGYQQRDQRTDRRTHPPIEMRGRI